MAYRHRASRPSASHYRARRYNFLSASVFLAAVLATTIGTFAQSDEKAAQRLALAQQRHLDARAAFQPSSMSPLAAQQAEVNDLRALMPDLKAEFDASTGATRSLWNMSGYLTPADGRDPKAIAEDFMASRTTLLGLAPSDVVDVELTDSVYSEISGVTHLYYRQRLNGVPVYNGQLQFNITRDGRILSVNNAFQPNLTASVASLRAAIDAPAAVAAAGEHLGVSGVGPTVTESARGIRQTTHMAAPDLSLEPVQAELMLLPIRKGAARLVWNFQVWTLDTQHAFDFTVDAETGAIWTRADWVASDSYRVYPQPVESPNHTSPAPPLDGRTLVMNPANASASPFGWHDTNGAPGAEFTTTEGNNVSAYTDIDANNVPDPGSSPDCGAGLNCDFVIDLTMAPSAYRPAAVANLFYWNNVIHDVQHRYGFNEAAGNFQVNNYGNGGLGSDSVQAEAQDGSGVNNANFGTPPDGLRPRMQMFVWTAPTPDLDGDLDSGIVVHEYGHGISNRLVGGPSNVSCLSNLQQPGEGISDFLTLVYTALGTDTAAQGRGIGTYALGQPTTGAGIRTQRYSTDNAINNWTYATISTGVSIPHGVGAVWAQGMWEVYWALVNQHGFDANLYNATGGAGNQRAMLYHTEGLKNASCGPGFTQMRDAVIQAAQTINGGEDVCRIWTAFAGFGLGTDAVNPTPHTVTGIVNGFQTPISCGGSGNPNMSIDDVSVTEGNAGTTTAMFTVSLAAASAGTSRVNYTTADGTAVAPVTTLTANTPTTIPSSGTATPYPVPLNVAGLTGTVANVAVRVNGFAHTWSDDVDMLLVGPGGQSSMFMSDIGGSASVSGVDLTFRDGAPPPPIPLVTGTFEPTNGSTTESLPGPAPAGPYGVPLSVFNGTDPNGTWNLYIVDDTAGDSGSLSGYSLLITTTGSGDYDTRSGQLVFPPGSLAQTISVTVNGDTTVEPNETFFVNLSNPVNATLVDSQGLGTILNDDSPGGSVPTTVDDVYATPFNTPLVVAAPGVLGNDNSNGGGAMTATLVTTSGGALVLNADGSFTYTPVSGFVGADSFTYRAVNGVGQGNVATAAVNVAAPTTVQPPFNLRVESVVGNTVTLRWEALPIGPQASTFVLEGGLTPGSVLASIPTGSPSPIFTFVAPTGSFFIRMHGQLGVDKSGPSNEVPLHVNVPVAPSAPANLLGLVNGSALALTWKHTFMGGAPTAVVLDVTGALATSLPLGPGESFSFAGVPPGTYTLSLRAMNAAGFSPSSNAVTLTFPGPCSGPPEVPANLLGYRIGNVAFAMWDPPLAGPAPTGYTLNVTGSFVGSFVTPGRALSGVVGPGTYNLSVVATNACGSSPASPVQVITVP